MQYSAIALSLLLSLPALADDEQHGSLIVGSAHTHSSEPKP